MKILQKIMNSFKANEKSATPPSKPSKKAKKKPVKKR